MQEVCLQGGRGFTDLVQEQGPAVGLAEETGLVAIGAR